MESDSALADRTEFGCPRCGMVVHERFYGPCGSCRAELVSQLRGTRHDLEEIAFEPKMNVTPNYVATKD